MTISLCYFPQRFRARPGLVLTVNFLYLMNEHADDARISFYDGTAESAPLLGSFKVSRQWRQLGAGSTSRDYGGRGLSVIYLFYFDIRFKK